MIFPLYLSIYALLVTILALIRIASEWLTLFEVTLISGAFVISTFLFCRFLKVRAVRIAKSLDPVQVEIYCFVVLVFAVILATLTFATHGIPLLDGIYEVQSSIYSSVLGRIFHLVAGKLTLVSLGMLILTAQSRRATSLRIPLSITLSLFYISYSSLQGSKAGLLWSSLFLMWVLWLREPYKVQRRSRLVFSKRITSRALFTSSIFSAIVVSYFYTMSTLRSEFSSLLYFFRVVIEDRLFKKVIDQNVHALKLFQYDYSTFNFLDLRVLIDKFSDGTNGLYLNELVVNSLNSVSASVQTGAVLVLPVASYIMYGASTVLILPAFYYSYLRLTLIASRFSPLLAAICVCYSFFVLQSLSIGSGNLISGFFFCLYELLAIILLGLIVLLISNIFSGIRAYI